MSLFHDCFTSYKQFKTEPSLFQVFIAHEQRGRNGAWDLGVEPVCWRVKGGNAVFYPLHVPGRLSPAPHKGHSGTRQDDLPVKSIPSLGPVV